MNTAKGDPKYFVSYYFISKDQSGHGCIELNGRKIMLYTDIRDWMTYLNDSVKDHYGNKCKCIVTFFKRLV